MYTKNIFTFDNSESVSEIKQTPEQKKLIGFKALVREFVDIIIVSSIPMPGSVYLISVETASTNVLEL